MDKKIRIAWVVVSAIWMLFMLNMSFGDLKYGLRYHVLHGRVEAEYREKLAAYDQAVREEEEGVRNMLRAAKRYDELEFLTLAARNARYRVGGNPPQADSLRVEMETLEQTYGKATLKEYREQDAGTEQAMLDEARARLIAPKMKESRLAAVLFNIFALPLAMLLLFWIYEQGYRRIVKYHL